MTCAYILIGLLDISRVIPTVNRKALSYAKLTDTKCTLFIYENYYIFVLKSNT